MNGAIQGGTGTPRRGRRLILAWFVAWLSGAGWAVSAESVVTVFRGMCDASAVIPIGERHQVVADDEDNILRIYDREAEGSPVWMLDLSRFLQVDPREPEADLEAGTRVGDRIYWITSHGRNRKGRLRPSRHRFFATEIRPGPGFPILEPVGIPSMRLLVDLLADPRLAGFGLARAASLPPKAPGALNIEGLTALPDGTLLLGFRNPQPHGRALLVPLGNPAELIAGGRARFGEPILLDLDHRGIRGLGTIDERVMIVAGASDASSRPRFFGWWPGEETATAWTTAAPADLNPESIEPFEVDGTTAWLVASDDGTVRIEGRECKQLQDASRRRFRTAVFMP